MDTWHGLVLGCLGPALKPASSSISSHWSVDLGHRRQEREDLSCWVMLREKILGQLFRRQNYSFQCCQFLFEVKSDLPSVGGTLQGPLSFPRPQPDAGDQDRAGSCL